MHSSDLMKLLNNPIVIVLFIFILIDSILAIFLTIRKTKSLKSGVSLKVEAKIRSSAITTKGRIIDIEKTGRYIGDDPEVKLTLNVMSESGEIETIETKDIMDFNSPYFTGDKIDVLYNSKIKRGMVNKTPVRDYRKHAK